jgi:hypothetical protein
MSREVIQDFLNLPGVVGIVLTNRRMRPYFYGLDAVLDRTKQALGQGVLQVVENLPEGFESFEFHFASHVVFIYKLTHGLVLLVLTDSGIKITDYRRGITKIKYLIEADTYNTVAYFKLLLGSVTQHSLPSTNWNSNNAQASAPSSAPAQPTTHSFISPIGNRQEKVTSPSPSSSSASDQSSQTNNQTNKIPSVNSNTNGQIQPNITKSQSPPAASATILAATTSSKEADRIDKSVSAQSVSGKTDTQEYKLDELLAALNKLSNFTTQYLGKVVVANYWKSSRPDSAWLTEFEIDRSGQISHPKQAAIVCNPPEQEQLHSWVASYIKRCKQVIRNFDQMIEQDCLDERQRKILLTVT